MKQKRFKLSQFWNSVKLLITKNLWLKVLSFILAVGTYVALYDNTVKKSDSKQDADIKMSFPAIIQKDRHPDAPPQCEPERNESPQIPKRI